MLRNTGGGKARRVEKRGIETEEERWEKRRMAGA